MAEGAVFIAVKPVAPVLDVDWLTGRVRTEPRHLVRTGSDEAACATGLALARSLGAPAVVVTVGGPTTTTVLLGAVSEGADRAVRVIVGDDDRNEAGPGDQWPSDVVAAAIASVAASATAVVCGDASGDRGSGTVPARLAHLLGVPQALCVRDVGVAGSTITAVRRLDGGRRERLSFDAPCVISVEPGSRSVRRAALARVLDAARSSSALEEVRVAVPSGARRGDPAGAVVGPYRPRASVVRAPSEANPILRGVELAGSLSRRDPPELLRCDPDDAAAAILVRLERWGLR